MTSYRDERDALRSQVDTLQQDLESARVDAAKAQQVGVLEERLAQAQRDLQAMHTELERLRGGPPKKTNNAPAIIVMGLAGGILVMGGAMFFLLQRAPTPAPAPAVAQEPIEAPRPVQPVKPVEPPKVAEPSKPEKARHSVVWKATVQHATGMAVAGPCTITATIRGEGDDADVGDVQIACGKTTLYDSKTPLNGMSMNSSDAKESAGAFSMVYSDKGARSGRTQASIDTSKHAAAAWSDDAPPFRVDLAVPANGFEAK
jgi:hypothetical protein